MRTFTGTNWLYSFWIDMNEPSVFNIAKLAMPGDNTHIREDGSKVTHKDLHNAYGPL